MFKNRLAAMKQKPATLKPHPVTIEYFYQVGNQLIKLQTPTKVELLNVLYVIYYYKCVVNCVSMINFRDELVSEIEFVNSVLGLDSLPINLNVVGSYQAFRDYVVSKPTMIEQYNRIEKIDGVFVHNGKKLNYKNIIGKCIPSEMVDQMFIDESFRPTEVQFDPILLHVAAVN